MLVEGRFTTHFGRPTFRIADVRDRLPLTRLRQWRRFLHRVEFHLEVGMPLSTVVALWLTTSGPCHYARAR
jgi:hypothetical protein